LGCISQDVVSASKRLVIVWAEGLTVQHLVGAYSANIDLNHERVECLQAWPAFKLRFDV
jgi:hypothetical protein